MKLLLLNTLQGLKPMYDDDYEEKKKLKVGQVYQCEIKLYRNVLFHRKYFALINCAWEYQNERTTEHFKHSIELFRKTIEVAAGHCDTIYSIERKEWVDVPRSIAFEKMDEVEFQNLYDKVRGVLFSVFLKNITEDEFRESLMNF